jgi:hypothetical protein
MEREMSFDIRAYEDGREEIEAIVCKMEAEGEKHEAVLALARILQSKMSAFRGFPNSFAYDYIMRGVATGIEDANVPNPRKTYILNNLRQGTEGLLNHLPEEKISQS